MSKCVSKYNYGILCTCHNCGANLSAGYGINVYSGGPFYCSRCNANVTEDLYGEKKPTTSSVDKTDHGI